RNTGFLPKGHAEQRPHVITIPHAAPELGHRRATFVRFDRSAHQRAVRILINGQHALTEILFWIFRARIELSGDPATAHEAVLVKVRAPSRHGAQVRWHRRGRMIGAPTYVRAASNTDRSSPPRLLR